MSRGQTISNILDELRAAVEEENSVQIQDDYNLLPILNRAHRKAYEILTQAYPEPLLDYRDIAVSTREFNLPENIYQDKLHKLYWIDSTGKKLGECSKAGVHQFSDEDSVGELGWPSSYVIFGRKIRFSADPSSTLRMWYMNELERLNEPIATIDGVTGTDTLQISELDASYNFTGGRTSSYVNIVDGQTGLIKATVQVRSSSTDTIVIRSSPDRTLVLNRDISSDLTALTDSKGDVITVNADDYVCDIKGVCVLPYWDLVADFMTQYSIAELKRELGYAYDVDQQLVTAFKVDMRKAALAGRDAPFVIRRRNAIWNTSRWLGKL